MAERRKATWNMYVCVPLPLFGDADGALCEQMVGWARLRTDALVEDRRTGASASTSV